MAQSNTHDVQSRKIVLIEGLNDGLRRQELKKMTGQTGNLISKP
jgi:hypothetical protein